MTKDEAVKIGKIVATADGGCSHCVQDLVHQLKKDFPEHTDVWEKVWEGMYD